MLLTNHLKTDFILNWKTLNFYVICIYKYVKFNYHKKLFIKIIKIIGSRLESWETPKIILTKKCKT